MRNLFIFIAFALILMGCSTAPERKSSIFYPMASSSQPVVDVAGYRDGMNAGAVISGELLGKVLCEQYAARPLECEKLKQDMGTLAILDIRGLSDADIKNLAYSSSDYRSAMKEGSKLFSIKVGAVTCKALDVQNSKCSELKQAILDASYSLINNLTDEQIRKIQRPPNEISI